MQEPPIHNRLRSIINSSARRLDVLQSQFYGCQLMIANLTTQEEACDMMRKMHKIKLQAVGEPEIVFSQVNAVYAGEKRETPDLWNLEYEGAMLGYSAYITKVQTTVPYFDIENATRACVSVILNQQ